MSLNRDKIMNTHNKARKDATTDRGNRHQLLRRGWRTDRHRLPMWTRVGL